MTNEVQPVRRRWTGLRVLTWVVGIVVIFGMIGAIFLPSLCKARPTANKAKCASNLHQIGLAISMYAADNGGQYPPSLAVLVKQEQLTSALMVCPASADSPADSDEAGIVKQLEDAESNAVGHKRVLSYVYVGKVLTVKTATATQVVAYEPLENHEGDGTNVLFGDGHAEWINKAEWEKMAAAAGVKVVVSASTQR